ncbi:MAG: MoxR family ATPase [Betaproteobacteria bacterium]|nr:MoxR family ATPase [Betaproteobacteria bacterium]
MNDASNTASGLPSTGNAPLSTPPVDAASVSTPPAGGTSSFGENLEKTWRVAQRLKEEIGRALIGQEAVLRHTLIALFAGGHVLVEGVPGLGKTLLFRALARTFNGSFSRIQFTPDLMPSDVTGHALYDMKAQEFRIRRGPVFTHLLLADEINRAPAKTQAALLEVMQEQQVTIEGQPQALPRPFMVMATQNPIEQEGTYPLPEAQLDRFLLKVLIDYPSLEEERRMIDCVTRHQVGDALNVEAVQPVVAPQTISAIQRITASITVDDRITDYAARIVRATRDWPGIAIGAGPRGSIALIRAARAAAVLEERDFVTPEDIKAVAPPSLRHRITLSPDFEMEGRTPDQLLATLLEHVEVPRQ